jgi:hypothetical protein
MTSPRLVETDIPDKGNFCHRSLPSQIEKELNKELDVVHIELFMLSKGKLRVKVVPTRGLLVVGNSLRLRS